jgi:hypothetical protein
VFAQRDVSHRVLPETERDLIGPVIGAENRAIFGPDNILVRDKCDFGLER